MSEFRRFCMMMAGQIIILSFCDAPADQSVLIALGVASIYIALNGDKK